MVLYYILVFVSPMPNHPLFEAPFAGLTVVKWLGIICCAYALFRLSYRQRSPGLFKSWEVRFFLMLLALATLSYLTLSRTANLTFNPIFMYFNYLPLFFTTICVVDTYERLRNSLLAAIAGEALASLYVIREFQASAGTDLRPGYIAGDANYFATCLLLVLPMTVLFVKMKDSRWQRFFCAGSLLVMLAAFTLASSRGGLVGLCALILYMIACSPRLRGVAIAVGVLLLPMLLFSPASPLLRMLHPNYGDYIGAQVRREFWRAGLDMIYSHPLTGIGLGNFTGRSVSQVAQGFKGIACNTFLEVAAELGIPGVLAYCAVLAAAFFSAGRLRTEAKKAGNSRLEYLGQAMQAGLLGFAAAAVFVSAEYQKPFWIITSLTATIPTLLRDIGVEKTVPQPVSAASTPKASFPELRIDDRSWAPLPSPTAWTTE
jgi:O-antigen ligase